MAEAKLPKSKLEAVVSDESSDDNENEDLGLSLDKLNLGPKKKLLVLCLGGLLVDRVHKREKNPFWELSEWDFFSLIFLVIVAMKFPFCYLQCPDVFDFLCMCAVFKRPFCDNFLKFCFDRFEVALWSSAREHNVHAILSHVMGEFRTKLLFVWDQEECTDSGFECLENSEKPIFLKELKNVWAKKYPSGSFSAANTLMIDNDPYKGLLNPPNTAIYPEKYKLDNRDDKFLGSKGELQEFLEGLADAEDVAKYVEEHAIGKKGITDSHPDWNYYSKIVARFSKNEKI